MQTRFSKILENLSSLAIISVSVLLGIVLVKHFILRKPANTRSDQVAQRSDPRPQPGTKISVAEIDWSRSSRTLVLAISNTCHYCTESAEFYKTLVQRKAGSSSVRIVAALPQTQEQAKAYLDKLGVSVDEVKQIPLASIGVSATPTLILIDRNGTVIESWVGKLPSDKENEVLGRL